MSSLISWQFASFAYRMWPERTLL